MKPMKSMKLTVYSDPGHAWCKVPITMLVKLGIEKNISTYSYQRNGYAYLEEDCDLTTLCKALKAKGINYTFIEKNTNKSSKIRSYSHYIPNWN